MRILSLLALLAPLILSGCGSDYSPNTYTPGAVQQAAKVDQGVIVGVRQVDITSAGVVGATTGAAAGGIIGSQSPGGGMGSAIGAVGGSLVGGLIGTTAEHVASDTTAWEYVVRKTAGEMVSVTQKDKAPLKLGQHVLVIAGPQARVVIDYTSPTMEAAAPVPPPKEAIRTAPPADTAPAPPPPVASAVPSAEAAIAAKLLEEKPMLPSTPQSALPAAALSQLPSLQN